MTQTSAVVILFDPIFQGVAISLMAGEVASVLLSLPTVPILDYLSRRQRSRKADAEIPVGAAEGVA